ncbi:MAG: UDP-2,3-diacylglucosamine diphosphatase LpxI [Rhizobiales bacterium]|nr:UDP-2,3-diacylglucosamine diphosphatase LpxI [Hyphomicrobiales bacterium]
MTAVAQTGRVAPGKPIGVLCFGGDLPVELAARALQANQPVFMVGFRGFANPAIETYPHVWVKLGQIGRFFRVLRQNAIERIVIVGALTRPSVRDLSLDWLGLWDLPRIIRMLRAGGDDSTLRRVVGYIEDRGVSVLGVSDIAPELLAGEGQLGRVAVGAEQENVAVGLALLDALSPFDIGQACIVLDRRPVAVEGVEGTDAMIRRVAELRSNGRLRVKGSRGVMVKAAKRDQDLRVDLPTIGPRTIELAAEAKLAGVAVEAGKALIADRAETLKLADRLGLFVVGVRRV